MKRWLIVVAILLPTTVFSAEKVNCEKVKNDEFMCLACNIYHESGNQNLDGKIAVAAVTINRVLSLYYPNSICRVVWQKNQFSWTHDGKPDVTSNKRSWNQSKDIALGIVKTKTGRPLGVFKDPTNCALFYHADYVDPYWTKDKRMKKTKKIQNHIFYRNVAMGCPTEDTIAVSANSSVKGDLN